MGGAIWWAAIGLVRHQEIWWAGFIVAGAAISTLFVVLAVGIYLRERKNPRLVRGSTITASITSDILTFRWPDGPELIRRSDIDRTRRAFGFVLLAATPRGVYMVTPSPLVPTDLI